MSELDIRTLQDRLEVLRRKIGMIDPSTAEVIEMTMLLRANVDDVNSILENTQHDQASLERIYSLITGLFKGVNSLSV